MWDSHRLLIRTGSETVVFSLEKIMTFYGSQVCVLFAVGCGSLIFSFAWINTKDSHIQPKAFILLLPCMFGF